MRVILETLERAFFVKGHDIQRGSPVSDPTSALDRPGHAGLLDVLGTLSQELNSLNSNIISALPPRVESRKRKRNEGTSDSHDLESPGARHAASTSFDDLSSCPVVTDYIDELLHAYFLHVQPWIPMVHEATFRKRLETAAGRQSQAVVLQAMNVAALRYVKTSTDEPLPRAYVAAETEKSRRHVILHAMDCLSMENLQALIIIAHTDVREAEALNIYIRHQLTDFEAR